MKIALCFSGLVRTFEECWPTYEKYLLSQYDCDIFGACPPNDKVCQYPFKKLLLQQDEHIDESKYHYKSPETGVQNSLRQFYFIDLANELRKQYEQQKMVKYDFVIRTRFDNIMTRTVLDLNSCNNEEIYIPTGHDHPVDSEGVGINDRFAIGSGSVMDIYCRKYYYIDDYMSKSGRRFHPETILKWVLDSHNVNIVRFAECTKLNRGNNEWI